MNFFKKFRNLSYNHHGYMKNKGQKQSYSSYTSLYIQQYGGKEIHTGLFLDLSKALDCLNLDKLLTKLFKYFFMEQKLRLLWNYLKERIRMVIITLYRKSISLLGKKLQRMFFSGIFWVHFYF